MTQRIEKLAKAALVQDAYSPAVEYTPDKHETAEDIGRAIAHYLSLQPMECREGELLADRYRFFGLKGVPTCFYRCLFGARGSYWVGHNMGHPTDGLFYFGWTHVALDYGYVLQNGLRVYIDRIAASERVHAGDREKEDFLCGMRLCLNGIIARYEAYATVVRKHADEALGTRRAELLRLADTLARVASKPAESFFDAVQLTWILFLLAPDSLGRIDQYLLPYYRADKEKGILTDAEAFELLEELFVRVHETQFYNKGLDISGHNHLVVGGYLQNGEDGFNELSKLILEAIADLPTYRPQASFRYTKKTSQKTMRYITEMNKRSQLIVFVNDEPRIDGMVSCGIDRKDAVEYTVIGCNEWAITGRSKLDLAHISFVHALESAIYNHKAPATFEEFYALFEKELALDFAAIVDEYGNYFRACHGDNNVLTSLFHDDCIENATTYATTGARYYGLTMSFNGVSNVADSLSVIKQFVYEEKRFSYEELLTALQDNWQGHEDMRAQILRDAHFFGNDDDYADDLACRILDSVYAIREQTQRPYIKNLIVGSFVGATHPNIVLGRKTKATPDGRFDGEEFTMGISQTGGRDKNGITALLKSIAKLDYGKFCGCVVSNLKMDKAMADTEEKLDRLAAMYHTFLMLGGMQLQINYLSTEELLAAQREPEKHKNLMVRVTGYTGYFTRFDTALQNDIIKRTEQCC